MKRLVAKGLRTRPETNPKLNTPPIDHIIMDLSRVFCRGKGIVGRQVTPFVLGRVAELSQGASLRANIALIKNNARVAAQLAANLAGKRGLNPSKGSPFEPQKRQFSTTSAAPGGQTPRKRPVSWSLKGPLAEFHWSSLVYIILGCYWRIDRWFCGQDLCPKNWGKPHGKSIAALRLAACGFDQGR